MNAIEKKDRCVVRNNNYRKSSFSIRERHNERKNEEYANPDIVRERNALNIHFKEPDGTYTQMFDERITDGTISTRGLKADATVLCEFVFDVNTACFEERGGYEYAKAFFEEAYRMAVDEVGGEQYILSAVMHADERNKGLSEECGHDVYHYHLHVAYIPVVEKEIRWSKRCKDEQLRGTVKERIMQVSRSKKWAFPPVVDVNGNPVLNKAGKPVRIASYSLLQDRFYEHMQEAGFDGFERGERGSTAQHLSVLDYKSQNTEALERIDQQVETRARQLSEIKGKLKVEKQVGASFHEIESMGQRNLFGKVELTELDYRKLKELAKEGVQSRGRIADLKQKLREAKERIDGLTLSYDRLREQTKDFLQAVKLAPQRMKEVMHEVFAKDREEREQAKLLRQQTRALKSKQRDIDAR